MACTVACDRVMYLASVDDNETICCQHEDQNIAPLPSKNSNAPVD
jgi:hypothetical protein